MVVRVCLALALTLFAGGQISAQSGQGRPISLIVPFNAGGSADIFARVVAQHLQTALNRPVVVENKPGAAGMIGAQHVAKAEADGSTLLMVTSTLTINETLQQKKSYSLMRDFVPVAAVCHSSLALIVGPTSPFHSVRDLVEYGKNNPGQINYGSTGIGTPLHLAAEMLTVKTGAKFAHVPYRLGGDAQSNLMSGIIGFIFEPTATAAPLVNAQKVRGLATVGASRSPALPQLPTMIEAGIADYELATLIGFMAPTGTPRPVIDRLNGEISKIVERPDVIQILTAQGVTPLVLTVDDWGAKLIQDIDKWAKVIQFANVKTE